MGEEDFLQRGLGPLPVGREWASGADHRLELPSLDAGFDDRASGQLGWQRAVPGHPW